MCVFGIDWASVSSIGQSHLGVPAEESPLVKFSVLSVTFHQVSPQQQPVAHTDSPAAEPF